MIFGVWLSVAYFFLDFSLFFFQQNTRQFET